MLTTLGVYCKNNHKTIFALLLLPAIMWLVFNSTANWHYHSLPGGVVVKHSHPYQQNNIPEDKVPLPFQGHDHTSLEYLIIDQFSKADGFETSAEFTNYFVQHAPLLIEYEQIQQFAVSGTLPKNLLRGPPSVI